MPNYCNWRVRISGLTEKQKERIGRWTVQGILCAMIIPYSKEVKKDLENKHNFDKEYALLRKKWLATEENMNKLKELYPYKDLWYDWCTNNRWSKWDLCDWCAYPTAEELELQFWTARSPVIKVFQRLSKKYHCSVSYDYDECGNWFSGRIKWMNGEELYHDEYDDWYYWEWERCAVCGCMYDGSNEDDRSNLDLHICYDCWHQWT